MQEGVVPPMPIILPGGRQRKGVGSTYAQFDPTIVGAQWYYNWGRTPPLRQGCEAVPMLWGKGSIGKEIGGSSPWLMWFNEPDISGQANLSPQEAADLWNAHVDDYPGVFHLSPAVANIAWLRVWFTMINRKPDAIAIHPYVNPGMEDPVGHFRSVLAEASEFANQTVLDRVWITEFAMVSSCPDQIEEYMPKALAVIKEFPKVTRYAWFQLSYEGTEPWGFPQYANLSLLDYSTGQATRLGRLYAFNNRVDVNLDGKVDILDISAVGANFGREVP